MASDMDKVLTLMPMEPNTSVSTKTVFITDKVLTLMPMEPNTSVGSKMTSDMD